MGPLRITMINADRGIAPGSTKGAALHLRGLAAGLLGLGHEVVVRSARPQEGSFPASVRPLSELRLSDVARSDVIYERYSLGHLAGLSLARQADVPFVLEVNAPLVDEALLHRPATVAPTHRSAELEIIGQADLVVTVSSALSQWARRRRSGPVAWIPNGFEAAWFAGDPPPTRWDLVFVGHPKPWHGADRLVPLLSDLADRGIEASLLVVGGGRGAEQLRKEARHVSLSSHVEVTGAVEPEEAARLTRSASIGLAPYPQISPFYFCPLKVIDYLAAGLPVVATDQGDIGRLVGTAGRLIDPGSPSALADAVADLLRSPRERLRLGRLARTQAHDQWTWRHAAVATVEAIEHLLRSEPLVMTP